MSARQATPLPCSGVAECRAQTEAAIEQGDFERAHDLAWRTVQQGPRNDRPLMFLLARTQALSNRPDDALVMIRRLAELGATVDASGDEFARTRDLPGWPAVEALIAGIANPPSVPTPPAPVASASASASARSEPTELRRDKPLAPEAPLAPVAPKAPEAPLAPLAIEEAGRFTSGVFAPGGLACDAVSKRFVFGDRPGRKLQILAEGSDYATDLTRAEVAGFLDVTALDIDTTNGSLWVATAEGDGRGATLHRVQLISGRPLASFPVPEALVPAQPADVAMAGSGAVLVLDTAQRRVLVLRPAATELTVLASLGDVVPLSLTLGRRDNVAYVSHRDGLLAIDLRTRAVSPVTAPKTIALAGFDRLRRHGTGFVGLQTTADGVRRLARLTLDANGRAVTRLRVIDVALPVGAASLPMAVCGDTLGFMQGEAAGEDTTWTIRRVRLNP
ncbi:MAG: hypothetical protein Q8O42_11455 [Acidobacteriota bacterium]|nr:hypothetical protein [Acidobacteriota bacterium]